MFKLNSIKKTEHNFCLSTFQVYENFLEWFNFDNVLILLWGWVVKLIFNVLVIKEGFSNNDK